MEVGAPPAPSNSLRTLGAGQRIRVGFLIEDPTEEFIETLAAMGVDNRVKLDRRTEALLVSWVADNALEAKYARRDDLRAELDELDAELATRVTVEGPEERLQDSAPGR